jgi:hypothetical protein
MMKFGQNDVNAINITSITEELEKYFNFFRISPSNWILYFEPSFLRFNILIMSHFMIMKFR